MPSLNLTLVTAIAGVAFGAIGTALGIFNTWKAIQRDKVRLKIIPKIFKSAHGGSLVSVNVPDNIAERWDGYCFEIVNIGHLPVTIDEIGLLPTDSGMRFIFRPDFGDGKQLPRRLEPRESVIGYARFEHPSSVIFTNGLPNIKCAFATTSCGVTVRGTSPVIDWLIRTGKQR